MCKFCCVGHSLEISIYGAGGLLHFPEGGVELVRPTVQEGEGGLARRRGTPQVGESGGVPVYTVGEDGDNVGEGSPGAHEFGKGLSRLLFDNVGDVGAVLPQLVQHGGKVCGGNCRVHAVFGEEGVGGRQVLKADVIGGSGGDHSAHVCGKLSHGGFALVLGLDEHGGHPLGLGALQLVSVEGGRKNVNGG